MPVQLAHVAVAVRDLEAATQRWATLLGRSPSWRGSYPAEGLANTFFALARGGLELLSPSGEGRGAERLEARLSLRGEGPCLLVFTSEDLGEESRRLRALGLAVTEPEKLLGHDSLSGAFRQLRWALLPGEATSGIAIAIAESLSPPELMPPAQAIGDERGAATGIDHVVVATPDAERAIPFYRDHLGLRLALDRSFVERGLRLVFFRSAGITLELSAPIPRAAEGATEPGGEDSIWGVAWSVPSASAARERLAAAGIAVGPLRDGHKPGTRVFAASDRAQTNGVATLCIEPAPR